MPALTVMFKTVSTDCNLDCSYCYYRESLEGATLERCRACPWLTAVGEAGLFEDEPAMPFEPDLVSAVEA